MPNKTVEEMTEDTVRLCSFYGNARGVFIEEGYASLAERELRHFAAEWIARLRVENEKLKREIEELKDDDFTSGIRSGHAGLSAMRKRRLKLREVEAGEGNNGEWIMMCALCGKVKDQDIWIVTSGNSGARITHTICPECTEQDREVGKREQEAKEADDE